MPRLRVDLDPGRTADSAAAIRRRARSTASTLTEIASIPRATSRSAYSGIDRGRLSADRRLQSRAPGPAEQFDDVLGDAGITLVEDLGDQLGVAVGTQQELGEIVGADRDAGDSEIGVAARWKRTEGTSAITQSSKPGRASRPACFDLVAAGDPASRGVRTKGSIRWKLVSAARPRPGRSAAQLEGAAAPVRACSAGRPGSRSSGWPPAGSKRSPPSQAAELVAAKVDRAVGDRARRECRRERRSASRPSARRRARLRRAPAAPAGARPSSASTTISSARSRPTPSTSRPATRSSWEGSERLTSSLVPVIGQPMGSL